MGVISLNDLNTVRSCVDESIYYKPQDLTVSRVSVVRSAYGQGINA